jgi:hypothetical protein
MGILKMATADLQDLSVFSSTYTYNGSWSCSTGAARTGTRSFYNNSTGASYATITIPNSISGYMRIAIKYMGLGAYVLLSDGIRGHIACKLFSNGIIALYRSVNVTDFATPLVNSFYTKVDNFNVFEIYWNINDTTGSIIIKANGIESLNYYGDTRNASLEYINTIDFGSVRSGDDAGGPSYFDDIIVRDDKWPGRGGIYVLKPNAGTTTEGWVASSGNPEDCVDEIPASGNDYISTNALVGGTQHLFGIESPPYSPSTIHGVGIYCKATTTAATDSYLSTLVKSSGTAVAGSGIGVDISPVWLSTYYADNPINSGSWTQSDIDNLEIGVQTVVM